HVGGLDIGDGADAQDAVLGVIGEDHEPTGRLDERAVGLRLHEVGRGETASHVHAVHAHEHDVEVHRPDGGDRERAHQSLRGGADATGEYHGLVGAGTLGEQVRDLYGVGDDGD